MNVRAWAAGLVVAFLAACGGGGGGKSDPSVSVSANPAIATLAGSTTGAAPDTSVDLAVTSYPDDGLYVLVKGSSKGYVTAAFDGQHGVTITGVNPATLAVGTYADSVTVDVCYDNQCARQVGNSPLQIPVTYSVSKGDPSTAVPTVVDTVPPSATAGGAGFTLTVDGTNFAPGSVVTWNGQVRASTYVSGSRLTVLVDAADIASITTASITVSNVQTGGGMSGNLIFPVTGPVPVISSLSPATASTGGSAFTLTVTGTGFDSTAQATWNGSPRTTTFVSPTQVTTQVGAADIAAAGTFPVGVYNTDSGSIASNTITLTVADAPLTLTSLAPAFVAVGGPAYAQTVIGTGFNASSTVQFNGSTRTTTFVSTTQLSAQLSAADIASSGSASIKVVNGGSDPATSSTLTLAIAPSTTDATAWQVNPQHNGAVRFANILAPAALPTSPAWTAPLDGRAGYPLIAGGRVFVVVTPGSGVGSELVALSAATGAVVWGPIQIAGSASATYDRGRVIVMASGGAMTGFDAATGNQLWSTTLPFETSFTAPPTAANGIAYTGGSGSSGALYAIDDATGALLWSKGVQNGDSSSPTVTSDGVYVTYPCQTYDFQPQTGALVWNDSAGCEGGGGATGASANGVYYSPNNGVGSAGQSFNAETGAKLSTYTGVPALGPSIGYFYLNGMLSAVDLASTTTLWSFGRNQGGLASPPILVNDYVIVGNMSALWALDAASGAQLWQTSLAGIPGVGSWTTLSQGGISAGDGLVLVPVNNTLVAFTFSNAP